MPTNSPRSGSRLLAVPALAAGAALALTGCMPTKASLEQRAPTIEARSTHSVVELSACMDAALTRYKNSNISFVPRPDGGSLTYIFAGMPFLTVSMVDHGDYRQVSVHVRALFNGTVKRHRLDAVRACL